MSEAPAESAYRPFNPHQRQAQQEQCDKIRNHKRPTAIARSLHGKSQKIA
jgi:hypothetical protein